MAAHVHIRQRVKVDSLFLVLVVGGDDGGHQACLQWHELFKIKEFNSQDQYISTPWGPGHDHCQCVTKLDSLYIIPIAQPAFFTPATGLYSCTVVWLGRHIIHVTFHIPLLSDTKALVAKPPPKLFLSVDLTMPASTRKLVCTLLYCLPVLPHEDGLSLFF